MRPWNRLAMAVCSLMIVAAQVAPAASQPEEPTRTPTLSEVKKLLLERTNAFRRQQGQDELKPDKKLAAAAQAFAEFMAKTDEYGHNADGRGPSERAALSGYEFCVLSENIAYQLSSEGFSTRELADKLVDGWKESAGHRKNMLDVDVSEAGMGVAHSEKSDRYYAVQMFGRPKSAAFEFEVINTTEDSTEYTLDGEKFDLPARVTRTHLLCRQAMLCFAWWKKDEKAQEFHPNQGDRFEVSKSGNRLRLHRKTGGDPSSKPVK